MMKSPVDIRDTSILGVLPKVKQLRSKIMQGIIETQQSCWKSCCYCPNTKFECEIDFVRHLREFHCVREGGSYVCRYGLNGVCPSLPLDGVSDRDYDTHVTHYHLNSLSIIHREMTFPVNSWCIYSAAQNLPAVLNDPLRTKPNNLFTKKWGTDFVEKCAISASEHLSEITYADFDNYITKIGKRLHRRRQRDEFSIKQVSGQMEKHVETFNHLLPLANNINTTKIPEIFLKENLNLQHAPTFALVFPGIDKGNLNDDNGKQQYYSISRQLQEQLSHYLDIVEVRIAQQVAHKSETFFNAMTTQDVIMREMQEAVISVRELRQTLKKLHETLVHHTFGILRVSYQRANYMEVLDKLSLMATVHKAQPMLQLLLGTQDYVAALELISTTQEIVSQELIGIQCFKHLPMQLVEMEKLIDKMLTAEFERFVAQNLHKSVKDVNNDNDMDRNKLVCIVMGLLRMKNFGFIDMYKEESILTIKVLIKEMLCEFMAESDSDTTLLGIAENLAQNLTIGSWITLLRTATIVLLAILQRIKNVILVIEQTTNVATGIHNGFESASDTTVDLIDIETFLTERDGIYIKQKLHDLLIAVTLYCHERCANLITKDSLEKEVATIDEITQLTELVEEFCQCSETLCGTASVPLKIALKEQESRFAKHFYTVRKERLASILESELWRQIEVPYEFQKLINRIGNGDFTYPISNQLFLSEKLLHNVDAPVNPLLLIESESYALVETVIVLVEIIYDYCQCAQFLPNVAVYMSRNLRSMLANFNSRCFQLLIGLDARKVVGLKTINTINLALESRTLQLILYLLPKIKAHFHSIDSTVISGFESLEKDYNDHVREIKLKIIAIVNEYIIGQLDNWNARPPIPSQCFRNISRQLVKLHEAIASILPEQQILNILDEIHRKFKLKFRELLAILNVLNNGSPQHGVVTSELTFYMETMRTLKSLPEKDNRLFETIWLPP